MHRRHGHQAGAGYTDNAAINDHRLKAIGAVSAVKIGQMFRTGWENNVKDSDAILYIQAGSDARTADAAGNGFVSMPQAPLKKEASPNAELADAWEYYHTPRAEPPNAPGDAAARSLPQIITYDAYHKAEPFLTQPLQLVAGSAAGSKRIIDVLYARAASTDKQFHVVDGASHMSLYDVPKYVDETVSVLATFFVSRLR